MALIWARGFSGAAALAPLWRRYWTAKVRAADRTLRAAERGAALVEAETAQAEYEQRTAEAEAALQQAAAGGLAHTHALIVGVGAYNNTGIPALTTSVHGALAFTEWLLTAFQHPEHPLGSIELVLSPGPELGDWQPGPAAAAQLGLEGAGCHLPVETASFGAVKEAFARWIKRGGTRLDNVAFFYFAGHGLWKGGPLLLPEDAQLPTATQPFANLIDIQQTLANMFNVPPSVQCMFIDACQELQPSLLNNVVGTPGEPLQQPTNGPLLSERDAIAYLGSYMGRKAYGRADRAPFFTEELLTCLARRSAASWLDGNTWSVTTDSLRTALLAASPWRTEEMSADPALSPAERANIQFSIMMPGTSTFTAELAQIEGPPEVFVQVRCQPRDAIVRGRPYVEIGGQRRFRAVSSGSDWYTVVPKENCVAGVEFEAGAQLAPKQRPFDPTPPLTVVQLAVKDQTATTGEMGGGA
jgi:hypothetical protein